MNLLTQTQICQPASANTCQQQHPMQISTESRGKRDSERKNGADKQWEGVFLPAATYLPQADKHREYDGAQPDSKHSVKEVASKH